MTLSSQPFDRRVSASILAIRSPVETLKPAWRAWLSPLRGSLTTFTSGNEVAISAVLSVEALLTTIISYVYLYFLTSFKIDSIQPAIYSSSLYAGTTKLILYGG